MVRRGQQELPRETTVSAGVMEGVDGVNGVTSFALSFLNAVSVAADPSVSQYAFQYQVQTAQLRLSAACYTMLIPSVSSCSITVSRQASS